MPPPAIQKSKEILRHGMQSTLDQVIQYERAAFIDCMNTEEHQLALNKLLGQMKFKKAKIKQSKK
jgi:enoyl-CoA hydratase/carnithine racemase